MNGNDVSRRQRRDTEAAAVPRSGGEEHTLKMDRIQIERKTFFFALRENQRGRFLRITEDSRGHRDRIIIPAPGLSEVKRVIEDMILSAAEPTGSGTAPPSTGDE